MLLDLRAAFGMVTAVPFYFVGDWNLTAVPMFLFMGYVAASAGLTTGLYRSMRLVLGRLPGGLAVATVGASALFAAASGSSVATAGAMARIATPEMLRYRYEPGLASGVVAASGTLGSLIPPSVLMILYGYFADVSVGKLFIAGIVPGILSALLFAAMIMVRASRDPDLAPKLEERASFREKARSLVEVWPLPVLIAGVLLGIFFGVFTPTEAGAVGGFLTLVIAAVRRALTWNMFREAVQETLVSTASIFLVVIGTVLLTRFMALSGLPDAVAASLMSLGSGKVVTIVMVSVLYLVLGMFLDSIGLLLLTLPIILPAAQSAGMDLVWFGVILVKLLEIGLVTPPVGLNVYVIKSALGRRYFGGCCGSSRPTS